MRIVVTVCTAAVFALLPIQFLVLPLNMSVADLCGFAVLPLCWLVLLHERQRPVLPLLPQFWVLAAVTGCAVMACRAPGDAMTSWLKELYLYGWLVTIATVWAHASRSASRQLLLTWCAVTYAHGALITAQFLVPSLLDGMNAVVASTGKLDLYRPSGLMENSNAAALFQLTGFVPLLALRLPAMRLMVLGAALLVTVLATGSMGATLGFGIGLGAGLVGLCVLHGDWRRVLHFTVAAGLSAALLALLLLAMMAVVPGFDERIQYVLTGRSGYSAESRYVIWTHGLELLSSELQPFGVGPDQFRALTGKELHNDVLAFTVERGWFGLLALLILVVGAGRHALQLARSGRATRDPSLLVFPCALIAIATVGMTHEVFHQRPVWMVLALQEAWWWRWSAQRRPQPAVDLASHGHRRSESTTRRTLSMT